MLNLNSKQSRRKFFLPMFDRSIEYFVKFLDVDLAIPMFKIYEDQINYSGMNYFNLPNYSEKVNNAEEEFRCTLLPTYAEVEQLHEITPPYIYKNIKAEIERSIGSLQAMIVISNLRKILKKSNETEFIIKEKNLMGDPEYIPREEKFDLELLDSVHIYRYWETLNYFIDDLKAASCPGETDVSKDKINGSNIKTSNDSISNLAVLNIEDIITDMPEFTDICDYYSEEKEFKDNNMKVTFKFINKVGEGDYHWNKYRRGAITTPFQYFIKMIYDNELLRFSDYKQNRMTDVLLKYFHIDEAISDHKLLFKGFLTLNDPRYTGFFQYHK